MAAKGRPPPEYLSFLKQASASVKQFGIFPLLRGVEHRAPEKERIGEGRKPGDVPVDIAHYPSLEFPAPTIEDIEFRYKDRPTIVGRYLGLTGPLGPLPYHLTEFAWDEQRRSDTPKPFGRWLDMISNRMLQFFFRAWANTQPLIEAERPSQDRHAAHISALSGAGEGVPEDAAFPLRVRLHYAALFASRRSATAIGDAMTHLLAMPATVLEFQPRWHQIEEEDTTRLGRQFATLGVDASLGDRVWSVSDAFRLRVDAGNLDEFADILPGGGLFPIAVEALDSFAPSHLDWDIQVTLDEAETPATRLNGEARLGWTSWLAPKGEAGRRRADVHLTRKHKPKNHTKPHFALSGG
ncbi:MAG: type VI secretion system baseplate subunit TssG [Pseudomonadota bacterium]